MSYQVGDPFTPERTDLMHRNPVDNLSGLEYVNRSLEGYGLVNRPAEMPTGYYVRRPRRANRRPRRRYRLAQSYESTVPMGTMQQMQGLGFSLKPPRFIRKLQPGKVLKKIAVPAAAVAVGLAIPGVAPALRTVAGTVGRAVGIGRAKSLLPVRSLAKAAKVPTGFSLLHPAGIKLPTPVDVAAFLRKAIPPSPPRPSPPVVAPSAVELPPVTGGGGGGAGGGLPEGPPPPEAPGEPQKAGLGGGTVAGLVVAGLVLFAFSKRRKAKAA